MNIKQFTSNKVKPIVSEIAKVLTNKEIDYKSLFLKAEQSDFLTGRNGKTDHRFTADWIINNADRVNSGKYDNPSVAKKKRTSSYDIEELEKIL